MKKLLLVAMLLAISGCTAKTEYGPCIGAFDDPDPNLVYKVSEWNIAMGVVFFESVVPPIIVVADDFRCPVRKK